MRKLLSESRDPLPVLPGDSLHRGCIRGSTEPLVYERDWQIAWKLLPVSAAIELTAVTLFVLSLVITLMQQPAHLVQASDLASNTGGAP